MPSFSPISSEPISSGNLVEGEGADIQVVASGLASVTHTATGSVSADVLAFVEVEASGMASVTHSVVGAVSVDVIETGAEIPPLSNAEMRELYVRVMELAAIHGLVQGAPLTVSQSGRAAGAVSQAISQTGETVTVTRA